MCSIEVTIKNPIGVHLRPAMKLCETAQKYQANSILKVRNVEVNLKSVLNVLAARICYEDVVTIICDGEDEEEVAQCLKKILLEEL